MLAEIPVGPESLGDPCGRPAAPARAARRPHGSPRLSRSATKPRCKPSPRTSSRSSEIEGEILDGDQVRSSLARRLGMDIGAFTPADRDVEGIVEMMLDATQKYDEPLTEERLFGWHAALFPTGRSGMRKITVGAWRNDTSGPMQVVSGPIGKERVHYEAPAAERLDRRDARVSRLVQRDRPTSIPCSRPRSRISGS